MNKCHLLIVLRDDNKFEWDAEFEKIHIEHRGTAYEVHVNENHFGFPVDYIKYLSLIKNEPNETLLGN